jgi:hypothetical protein
MTQLQQKTHDTFQKMYEVLAGVANMNLGSPVGARVVALRDLLYDVVRLLSHDDIVAQPDAFRVLKAQAHIAVSRMRGLKAEVGSTLKLEPPVNKMVSVLDRALAIAGKFFPGACAA